MLTAALLAAPAAAAQPDPARNLTCAPTEAVKAALAKVPRRDPDCDPSQDCWVEKIHAAEALVDKYPFDVHVHRRYQDLVNARDNDAKAPLAVATTERYQRFLADYPDDPLPHYLVARYNNDVKEAQRSLELNPTFPWPHMLLAALLDGSSPGTLVAGGRFTQPPPGWADELPNADSAAAGREFEAFARLCPNRFDEVLRRASQTAAPEVWRRILPNARAAMLKGPPGDQMLWYQTLWEREFAAWPPESHGTVRSRLRNDLTRIEGWKRRGDESWWQLLQAGYKMLDDPPGLERIEAGYAKRFPCSWTGVDRTIAAFVASIGGSEHLHDQTQSQWRDTYDQSGRWTKACPDQYRYISYRFEAAARRDDLDDRAIVAEADAYLAAWEPISTEWTVHPSPYSEVAAEFLRRGIEPQRALDFALKAGTALTAERKRREEWDLTGDQKKSYAGWDRIFDFDSLGLVAEAALASGHRDESEAALAKADALYQGWNQKEREALSNSTGAHARYWRVHARLAEAARRPPDALAYWRLAVQHADPHEFSRATARDQASLDRLWRDLGGTEAGLAAWMSAGATPTAVAQAGRPAGTDESVSPEADEPATWTSHDKALPPFTLRDTTGRTWKLAELTGKTLFINVWATWCGPCKAEIPQLQKLSAGLAGRTDVVMLSFNTDDSPGMVAPFVSANKVAWPVLFAANYVESLNEERAVPQNWLVDGSGVRRRLQVGFAAGPAGETWVGDTLALIDRLSGGSGASEAAPAPTAPSPPSHP